MIWEHPLRRRPHPPDLKDALFFGSQHVWPSRLELEFARSSICNSSFFQPITRTDNTIEPRHTYVCMYHSMQLSGNCFWVNNKQSAEHTQQMNTVNMLKKKRSKVVNAGTNPPPSVSACTNSSTKYSSVGREGFGITVLQTLVMHESWNRNHFTQEKVNVGVAGKPQN